MIPLVDVLVGSLIIDTLAAKRASTFSDSGCLGNRDPHNQLQILSTVHPDWRSDKRKRLHRKRFFSQQFWRARCPLNQIRRFKAKSDDPAIGLQEEETQPIWTEQKPLEESTIVMKASSPACLCWPSLKRRTTMPSVKESLAAAQQLLEEKLANNASVRGIISFACCLDSAGVVCAFHMPGWLSAWYLSSSLLCWHGMLPFSLTYSLYPWHYACAFL